MIVYTIILTLSILLHVTQNQDSIKFPIESTRSNLHIQLGSIQIAHSFVAYAREHIFDIFAFPGSCVYARNNPNSRAHYVGICIPGSHAHIRDP